MASLVLQKHTIPAPKQLRALVQEKIGQGINGGAVLDGEIELGFKEGFNPRILLTNVSLRNDDGSEFLWLSNVDVVLDMATIWTAEPKMRSAAVSGMRIAGRRNTDGSYDFEFPDAGGTGFSGIDNNNILGVVQTVLEQNNLGDVEHVEFNQIVFDYTDNVVKRRWTFDGGRIAYTKRDEYTRLRTDLALLSGIGGLGTLALEVSETGDGDTQISAEIDGLDARDVALQIPTLPWLGFIEASLTGTVRTSISDQGFGPLHANFDFGQGTFKTSSYEAPTEFTAAKVNISIFEDQSRMDINTLEVASDWGNLSASGHAILQDDDMIVQLTADALTARSNNYLDTPVTADFAALDAKMRFAPFALEIGRAQIDMGDTQILAKGRLAENGPHMDSQFRVMVDQFSVAKALQIWPDGMRGKLRQWFDKNTKGQVENLVITTSKRDGEAFDTALSLGFTGAQVRYLKDFPPMTGANGVAHLRNGAFAVSVQGAEIQSPAGDTIQISNGTYEIPNVALMPAPVRVKMQMGSTAKALMSVLALPPVNLLDQINRPADFVSADLQTDLDLSFVQSKDPSKQNITYLVNAVGTDVSSKSLIPDRVFSSDRMKLVATPKYVSVTGPFDVDGVTGQGEWSMALAKGQTKSSVTGDVRITPAALKMFGLGPVLAAKGGSTGKLVATLDKGRTDFGLKIPLRGMAIHVPMINWTKSQSSGGSVRVKGRLNPKLSRAAVAVDAPGLNGQMMLNLNGAGKVTSVNVRNLNMLGVSNGDLSFEVGNTNRITMTNGVVDLAGLVKRMQGTTQGSGKPLSASVPQLRISKSISLTGVKWQSGVGGNVIGQFSGRINGGAPVQGTVRRNGPDTQIDITSPNGGGVLASAGILRMISSGDLKLKLIAQKNGTIRGQAELLNSRMSNGPTIAKVLSAISVVGLFEQADGKGLVLTETLADFTIKDGTVILHSSSAIGPSMGLSLDGYIFTKTGQVDLQGVVSPFFMINGIGSIFTRKGEGLLGFNFNLKGAGASPKVSVNPLSILTPGLFREIFRRSPPKAVQ